MSSIWRLLSRRRCAHESTLVVTSVGVRRSVCEECGHISFDMEPSPQLVSGHGDRPKLPKAVGF